MNVCRSGPGRMRRPCAAWER